MPKTESEPTVDELLARLNKLKDETSKFLEYNDQHGKLLDELREDSRKNAAFLVDKTLPIFTAIVGGIVYVLLEKKLTSQLSLNCFRISGVLLTLVIVMTIFRLWIDPYVENELKRTFLAIQHQQTPRQSRLLSFMDAIEPYRLAFMLLFMVVGLGLAMFASLFESAHV